jgi:hypothetical protein
MNKLELETIGNIASLFAGEENPPKFTQRIIIQSSNVFKVTLEMLPTYWSL